MARRGARGRWGLSGQDEPAGPSRNPAAIVASLNQHQVRYVIIGAFAAIAQQAPIPATRDIDVTPEASQENLARLSRALIDLGARIRTEAVPDGLPFRHDAASLAAAEVWNLVCADGEFDISFRPPGFPAGYRQLALNARPLPVGQVRAVAAAPPDWARAKGPP